MATPPFVDAADAADAISRIRRRHQPTGNPDLHLLTDDARDALAYLQKRGPGRLLANGESHDLEDATTLRLYLLWRGLEDELWILDAAEVLRVPHKQLGAVLGIRSSAGVHDRHDRLRALFGPDRKPSEKRARRDRRDNPARPAYTVRRKVNQPVVAVAHRAPAVDTDQVRAVLARLARHVAHLPLDAAEQAISLYERRDTLPGGELTAAARTLLDGVDGAEDLPASTRNLLDELADLVGA